MALTVGGIAALVHGIWQVYPPAAWIVGGSTATWIGLKAVDDGPTSPDPPRPGGRR